MKTKMPNNWYDYLVEVCSIQSSSENEKLMVLYLDKKLQELSLPYTIDAAGNVIVTKGEAKTYPCIVSHMDTVHDIKKNYTIYVNKPKGVLFAKSNNKMTGIGGDDKCGIFACLYFLKVLPAVKVVFFSREEIGCKGSRDIDLQFFDNCRYVIQLDRKGNSDFIDVKFGDKTISHEFSSEVGHLKKEYGFNSTTGTVTDAVTLWSNRGVGISCINISAGYYKPHSDDEYIKIDELWNSIRFTKDIISTLKPKRYVCKKPKVNSVGYSRTFYDSNSKLAKPVWCSYCKQSKAASSGTYINKVFKCWSCCSADDNLDICSVCYNYKDVKSLLYDSKLNKTACEECRTKGSDDKDRVKMICSICKEWIPVRQGRRNIEVNDIIYLFICDMCYSTITNNVSSLKSTQSDKRQDEYLSKTDVEICSVCESVVEITQGRYNGELFVCYDCLGEGDNTNIIKVSNKTEICDRCYQSINLSDGKYTGRKLRDIRTKRYYEQFICNKCSEIG